MTPTERAAVTEAIREAISIHSSPTIDRGDGHGNRGQSGYIVWESSMPFVIASVVRALAPAPAESVGHIEFVAAAIAALEPFANKADSGAVHGALRENGLLTVVAPNGFSFLLEPGAFPYARTALASLRAVAPTPADQSDAGHGISSEELRRIDPINPGFIDALEEVNRRENDARRDGVIEECAQIVERCMLSSRAMPIPMQKAAKAIRALASAPSETVGRREEAIDWSKPIETDEDVPRHARVVGETKSTLDYFVVRIDSREDKYDSSYHHPAGEYRALKSNGFIRGNLSVRNEAVIAECAADNRSDFKWFDPECGQLGCQSMVWKGRYESAVKGRSDFRQATKEARAAALSTADRDAIREALKESIAIIDENRGPFSIEVSVIKPKLTAALALIREG